MFYPVIIGLAIAVGLDVLFAGTSVDNTVDLDSQARFAAKHRNDTGEVPGDIVNGLYTGGDGTQYRYLFTSHDGERVFAVAGRDSGNAWIISIVPGVQPILWAVPPPPSLVSSGVLNASDLVRATTAPQAVYTRSGTLRGSIDASGRFSAGTSSGVRSS